MHISMLSVLVYSERKGETEHIKSDQLSGLKLFSKQCVSAWLSISVLSASTKILLPSSHVWQALAITKVYIDYVPLNPVADYVHILDLKTRLRVG